MQLHGESIARTAHWCFAVFVIAMLAIGFYMTNTIYNLPTYQLHKSLGVIFLTLVSVLVYLRFKHPWRSSSVGTKREGIVKLIHYLLLILMVAMPLTGVMSSGFSGFSVHLFDLIIIPENQTASGDIVAYNDAAYQTAKVLHRVIGYVLAALVSLHIYAAQFAKRVRGC